MSQNAPRPGRTPTSRPLYLEVTSPTTLRILKWVLPTDCVLSAIRQDQRKCLLLRSQARCKVVSVLPTTLRILLYKLLYYYRYIHFYSINTVTISFFFLLTKSYLIALFSIKTLPIHNRSATTAQVNYKKSWNSKAAIPASFLEKHKPI